MNLLRAFDPALFDRLQPYRVTDDALMPWAYQRANPQGRPLHDDWGVMGVLPALQPWQRIPRIECAYRVPLPFKQISGATERRWLPWDISYPTVPGTLIEERVVYTSGGKYMIPHALFDCAIGSGWSSFAAWLGGEWVPCFKQYHKRIFGRRLAYYNGLKQDVTVSVEPDGSTKSDLMAWFPEISMTWIKTD